MDKSNKTWNHDQDKKHKKMAIKFGGGGMGAVILLATAALASAFAARIQRRSSGKDRRSHPPPENDKPSEQDESKNDTVSLALDVEMNGVSDDGFVIVDEDFPQSLNKTIKDADDYSEEKENQEQVNIEEGEKIEIIQADRGVGEEREIGDEEICVEGESNQIGEIVLEDEESLNDEKQEKQRNETKGMIEKNKQEETTKEEAEADAKAQTTNVDLETSEEERSLGSEDSSSKSKVDDQTVKYYMVEMGMKKENSGRRRVGIATISFLSSLSCSWFFGLSFTKLCLLLFLTMVLSELHGY